MYMEGYVMKKIAVMCSEQGHIFEAIAKYFNNKDVEIVCITDILNSPVIEIAKNYDLEYKYLPYEQNAQYFSAMSFDLIVLAGYRQKLHSDVLETGTFINIHPSLLPAFSGEDAIQRAFLAGVKVSGVTIHYLANDINQEKIIAQYPVLIPALMHYDEYEAEINKTENMLYPIVIEKLLKDEVFDFSDLIGGCSSGCGNCEGGCGGCH